MNYDHDCPFEAYITNLGKYNEGALVGEWVKFPTTYDELQKVFERIGIGREYEEWFITDYDCYVDGLNDILSEYENLDELNYLANKIDDMDRFDYMRFETLIPISDYAHSVKDLINLADNLDKYEIYSDIQDHDDLGRMYIEEYGAMEVPEHLKNHIDYEAYGRDIALDEIGIFTDKGYVRDSGDNFYEHYDGNRENIPEEYRVISAPDDIELSGDGMLEQAQEPLAPDNFMTGEKVTTPRGSFSLTDMTKAQMEAVGYGLHHSSDDGLYHIMGNGTRAFAIINEDARTYDIYQLKDIPDRRDYAFESLDRLREQGHTVDIQNYDKVYSGVMHPNENLENIYARFNIDHPQDFKGHSLSVSDVVVIHQHGQHTAHYCDSFGFAQVPKFLQPENHLKNAEMAMEDDYGMIDGIINNGPKEKPSIREQLTEAKRERSERKPPIVKKPDKSEPEHGL